MRENASQAKAWDAVEAVLRHPKLVFSASLANELACTAEALYARGDAGGQLYAAARGLHECCGDVASIAQSLQSQQKLVIQPGARAAACVVLGALCANYPRRLGPGALGEARQRLAKLAKNDRHQIAAARALGCVSSRRPTRPTGARRPVRRSSTSGPACPGMTAAALAKVLKGSDDATRCKAAAASLLPSRSAARPRLLTGPKANLAAVVVADAAETSKPPAPRRAPKKQGEKEPVPDDPVKRARSTVDAALHLLDASVAVRKPNNVASMAWGA